MRGQPADELLALGAHLVAARREQQIAVDSVLDRALQSADLRRLRGDLLLQLLILRLELMNLTLELLVYPASVTAESSKDTIVRRRSVMRSSGAGESSR